MLFNLNLELSKDIIHIIFKISPKEKEVFLDIFQALIQQPFF